MVEFLPSKQAVAGSNPVSRSITLDIVVFTINGVSICPLFVLIIRPICKINNPTIMFSYSYIPEGVAFYHPHTPLYR